MSRFVQFSRRAALFFCLVLALPAWAETVPPAASANGKYQGLIQVLPCPQDRSSYGEFRDYGHWAGGPWCGQQGRAGYWVYVHPNWYIWEGEAQSTSIQASADGKYDELLQVLTCPADEAKYGEFHDYGHWAGGPWCGQQGRAGYWVWVKPSWYVWNKRK